MRHLRVLAVNEKQLQITGLDTVFAVFPTRDAAVEAQQA